MRNVISAELYKLNRSKSLLIITCVVAGVSLLVAGMANFVQSVATYEEFIASFFGTLAPDAANLPFTIFDGLNQLFVLCLAIFAATDIVKDFDNGGFKNAVVVGRTRSAWLAAKMLNLLIASALFIIFATVTYTALFMFNVAWLTPLSLAYLGRLMVYFAMETLICFAYGSIFALLAFLLRSVGGVIGICIGFTVAESMVYQLMSLIDQPILKTLVNILPITMTNQLNGVAQGRLTYGAYGNIVLIAAVIIAATTCINVLILQKRDI